MNSKQLHNCIFFTVLMVTIHLSLPSCSLDGKATLFISPSLSKPCPANPCLTLSQFAQDSTSWLSVNTSLIFLTGNHTLNAELSISSISHLSIRTDSTYEGTHIVICQHQANFNFEHAIELRIEGLNIIGCGSNRFLSIKNFTIENCTFQGQNNSGTALDITETNLTLVNSSFVSNRVGSCLDIFDVNTESNISVRIGGAILVTNSNVSIIKCSFLENSAEIGGAIYVHDFSNISIVNNTFVNNRATINSALIQECWKNDSRGEAKSVGGVFATFKSRLAIDSCSFTNNTSEAGEGGALSIQQESFTNIHKSEFHGNRANGSGGAIIIATLSNVTIESSKFLNNNADQGGVMYIGIISNVTGRDCVYKNNLAKFSGGVVSMDQSSLFHDHHGQFFHNQAKTGGAFHAIRSELTLSDSVFSFNQATESGGVMYILQSQREVVFYGICNLTHNSAATGGAIYAIESILSVHSVDIINIAPFYILSIAFNKASDSGGGVYLYHSILNSGYSSITNISCNKANSHGGGIHAINSLITCTQSYRKGRAWPFQTFIIFAKNSAKKGGGLYLESAAQLRIQKVGDAVYLREANLNTSIYFTSNFAWYGAAVYVADETYFDVCGGRYSMMNITATSNAECFIQVFSETTALAEKSITYIEFTMHDHDFSTSSIIFGGLLDRCIPDPRAEIFTNGYIQKEVDGITYLKLISNVADTEYISSLPVRVCFCRPDYTQSDCSYEPPIVYVKKGESFNMSLVAVDQVNHTLKSVEIYSSLNHAGSSLGENQSPQVTKDACTNLTFSIYSPHASEELILYAEGPCRNASKSQSRVHIVFQPCTCPVGFQPEYKRHDCVCVCDSHLSPYFTEADNNCNYLKESLIRQGNFWIDFINDTDRDHNSSGFLIYPYCPLDYCLPPISNVQINLNLVNGADTQCANNRSGLLCALCQPGLSLSYGSSQCISCSKTWYKGYVPVVLITIVAGILLVALLMMLNLTVAIGTLNGLIFYANIIGANKSTFFSGLSPSTKFYSVLISWLNLEVGFDVCIFEGMDSYWKTWLQLAFPTYVILLVAIMIIVSEHSMRFSRLIARRNPVATLATLIMLSYTKFLQTTITTLSLANLDYPDGSKKRVWLPDATVEYLSGKHIPLLVVAVVILVIGFAYTCVIFFWQWLLLYQDRTIIKWTKSQRLYHFIEPYHAPYAAKHRYWTGLLLFIRIALYFVFALNVSGDPGVNLLVIIISVVSLLLVKGQFGRVYKSNFVDMTEMTCYTHLCVFSAIRLKFGDEEIVSIAAHISGVVTLLLLMIIISYHVYTMFCSKCFQKCQRSTERQLGDSQLTNDNTIDSLSTESYRSKPTSSIVELNLPVSSRQHSATNKRDQLSRATSETNDDNVSLISADSISPLVGSCG